MKTVISPEWHKLAQKEGVVLNQSNEDRQEVYRLAFADGVVAYASSAEKWLKDKLTEVKNDFCIDETDKAQQFVKELMLEELLTELKTLKPL